MLKPWLNGSRMLPPWLALAILLGIQLAALPFLLKLHFNNAPDIYSPPDSSTIQLRESLFREFPNDEAVIALFEGDVLYAPAFLAALDRAAQKMAAHPAVDRVLTLTTVEHIDATDDGFAVSLLVDPDDLATRTPAEWKARVLGDSFAPGLLASRDGRAVALVVRPKILKESLARRDIQIALDAAIAAEKLTPYHTATAGTVAQTVEELRSLWRDSAIFIPLTFVIGMALLWWVVGRVRPMVVGGLAMGTVVSASVAGLVLSGQPYTPITAMIPTLMAAYTTATLLHLYAAIQRARIALLPRPQRIARALKETFVPGLFNVLTTGAGMLSLLWVDIPPVQAFGLAGAVGTLIVFLVVFILVPPILLKWDTPRWPRRRSGMAHARRIAAAVAVFSLRHAKAVLTVTALLVLAAIPLVMQVKVESNIIEFFAPDHGISRSTARVESALSGVTGLEIVLTGTARDSLKDPATLAQIKALQTWLEQQPEVDRSFSLIDVLEEMNRALSGEDLGADALPTSRKLVEQLLLIYDGKDLYELVNREFQRARIPMGLNVHGANEIGQVIDRVRAHVAAQPIAGVEVDLAGYGRLFSDQEDRIVDGQVKSFASAFLQILLLMALLFRSFRGALICLVPNLAPLFFIFVVMGTVGISLDVATVLIAGVILGITVDDTIHLYHGYLHRIRRGVSPVFAIIRSVEASGRAVIAISMVLIAQFSLLGLSDFRPTAHFGMLCAVGLFAGQVFELLLMPALLGLKLPRPRPAVTAR
ncbi:MMPL family transporter [Thiobacillus sp. 65-1402]|uniref:efflux RND transporter permease subunit n=1 Tax=Thiobacillus sp. 65-1402 TaxID=1895861 RepID=UPI00095B7177|nr:MMPL family transporter [Thiobacillus sp. 65-1402]OJW98888.1 MAG: RND transporter [Thiobacillus sp. 65-1402]